MLTGGATGGEMATVQQVAQYGAVMLNANI